MEYVGTNFNKNDPELVMKVDAYIIEGYSNSAIREKLHLDSKSTLPTIRRCKLEDRLYRPGPFNEITRYMIKNLLKNGKTHDEIIKELKLYDNPRVRRAIQTLEYSNNLD